MQIPETGTEVTIEPLSPFDKIPLNLVYTLVSNALIPDLLVSGGDVLNDVYIPVGLTLVDLQNDISNKVPILSFSNGGIINIPANRVRFIDEGEVKYTKYGLGFNMGTLPVDFDFTDLAIEIQALIETRIGVKVSHNLVNLSSPVSIPLSEHEELEAIRLAQVTDVLSCSTKLIMSQSEINSLNNKIAKLSACVISLNP